MNAVETLRALAWGDRFRYRGRVYTLLVGHGESGAYGTARQSWADVDRAAAIDALIWGEGAVRIHVSGRSGYSTAITVRPDVPVEVLPRTIPEGV